jgi:hypothetical protein
MIAPSEPYEILCGDMGGSWCPPTRFSNPRLARLAFYRMCAEPPLTLEFPVAFVRLTGPSGETLGSWEMGTGFLLHPPEDDRAPSARSASNTR